MLVFVHIPKAAGTTLHHVLKRAVGQRKSLHAGKSWETQALREMPKRKAQKFQLISAHMTQPELEKLCGQDAEYVTITRDPVDRFVSLYYFLQAQTQHEQHKLYSNMSFEDFLAKYESDSSLLVMNCQARYLSGENNAEKALECLEKKFFMAAPIEKFDKFIWRLFAKKQLVPIEFTSSNQNEKRPKIEHVNADIKARILHLFKEDAKIHQHMLLNYK